VVVLIIGILSVSALPLYNQAMHKARFSTLKEVTKAIADAEEVYFTANHFYSTKFSELDVQLPPGGKPPSSDSDADNVYSWNWGACYFNNSGGQAIAIVCRANKTEGGNVEYMSYRIYFDDETESPDRAGKRECNIVGTGLTKADKNSPQGKVCAAETKDLSPRWIDGGRTISWTY